MSGPGPPPALPELSDATLDRLRRLVEWPDLGGTRYEVVRELARGGMGIVYEARDLELDRPVALKVLALGDAAAEADAVERLRREARIIAGLEHPGIVPVHDVGSLPDGRVYYAMKLVGGSRLDALVREGRPRAELLRIFLRVCEPVAFAHAHGVIHRDLKPENVMVGRFGEVLVMDFGVAKRVGERASSPPSPGPAAPSLAATGTAHGTILGTPGYMAPEQARGEVERLDARADVYALGAILYFLLTAEPPGPLPAADPGASTRTWSGYAGDRPAPVSLPRCRAPGVPRPLEAICLKALAPEPAARYPGAQELAADVVQFLEAGPVSAFPEGPWQRARRFAWRYRTPLLLVFAYLAMRVLLLMFLGV